MHLEHVWDAFDALAGDPLNRSNDTHGRYSNIGRQLFAFEALIEFLPSSGFKPLFGFEASLGFKASFDVRALWRWLDMHWGDTMKTPRQAAMQLQDYLGFHALFTYRLWLAS